jgi:hypothetical protein
MTTKTILTIVLLVSPILLIQLGMVIYALLDLARRKAVRGPRWVWVVALILCIFAVPTGILVSGIYLYWGRQNDGEDGDDSN